MSGWRACTVSSSSTTTPASDSRRERCSRRTGSTSSASPRTGRPAWRPPARSGRISCCSTSACRTSRGSRSPGSWRSTVRRPFVVLTSTSRGQRVRPAARRQPGARVHPQGRALRRGDPGAGRGRVTLRIVLADDSLLLREGIARLLAEAGFEVVAQAGDADELLGAIREHRPDVAIVDIRMPPTFTDEGLKAAQAIRAEHGTSVGILVLSQYVETTFALRLVADGAGGIGLPAQGPGRRPRRFRGRHPADRARRLGDRPGGRRPARRAPAGEGAARRPDRARARGARR